MLSPRKEAEMNLFALTSPVRFKRVLMVLTLIYFSQISPILSCRPDDNNNNDLDLDHDHDKDLLMLKQEALSSTTITTTNTINNNLDNQKEEEQQPDESAHPLESEIHSFRDDILIARFRQVVSEEVNLHHASWIRHTGLIKEKMTAPKTRQQKVSTPPSESTSTFEQASSQPSQYCFDNNNLKDDELKAMPDRKLMPNQNNGGEQQQRQNHMRTMIWDDDNKINDIFLRLAAGCGLSTRSHWKDFRHSCLNYLNHLIYYPRCTTHYDSRTTCVQARMTTKPPYDTITAPADDDDDDGRILSLIESHFTTTDTLNILILGGGPVGLVLANALSQLHVKHPSNQIPDIRIIIFETRVSTGEHQEHPGRKLPYTRDWITDIPPQLLYDIIDPRITKLLKKLHQNEGQDTQENIALPINALETLLLMSNRSNSKVKFVFEKQFLDMTTSKLKTLLQKIPSSQANNMIVFDATGHRLVSFDQVVEAAVLQFDPNTPLSTPTEDNTKATTTNIEISNYSPNSKKTMQQIQESLRIRPSDIELLHDSNQQLQIARINTSSNKNTGSNNDTAQHEHNSQEHLLYFAHGLTYPVLAEETTENTGVDADTDPSTETLRLLLPYKIHLMKILGFPLSPTIWRSLMKIQNESFRKFPPLCVGRASGDDSMYRNWCGPHFMYEMTKNYRKELQQLMQFASTNQGMQAAARSRDGDGDTLITDCCGFAVRAVISNLTPEQATALKEIMTTNLNNQALLSEEEALSKNEVPLSSMPINDVLHDSGVFRVNQIDEIISILWENDQQRRPPRNPNQQKQPQHAQPKTKFSVFEYQPYMYTDPLVPSFASQHLLGLDVPLIRVGDSLLSGDVNASTGLVKHLKIIHVWMKHLSDYYESNKNLKAHTNPIEQ